jgi:CarD family transcriptional regulator
MSSNWSMEDGVSSKRSVKMSPKSKATSTAKPSKAKVASKPKPKTAGKPASAQASKLNAKAQAKAGLRTAGTSGAVPSSSAETKAAQLADRRAAAKSAAQAAFDSAEAIATQMMNTAMKATVKTVVKTVVRNITPKSSAARVAAEPAPLQTSVSETMIQAELTTQTSVESSVQLEADEESILSPELLARTNQDDGLKNIPIPQPKGPRQPIVAKRPANWDELIEFRVGDNAVYPGHGVGRVNAIECKEIAGKKLTFYSIQILETGMKIMVPQGNVKSVGLRPIISKTEAEEVIGILKQTNVKIDNQTWNRRYREYMEKIKTGGVREIAEVLRDLFLLKVDKELSFGERKMLDTARSLLIKELILATGRDQLEQEGEVKAILGL